jgi:Ca2+-binding RTX toxin-like protein
MAYNITGTAGSDTLNQAADPGPGTIVGLAGNDLIRTGTGDAIVDGGSGADTVVLQAGNIGQVTMGTENDSIYSGVADIGSMVLFGNEGADTINIDNSANAQTILGGNDSADSGDSIVSGSGTDIIFGHGGDDTLYAGLGNDTYVGGFGNDRITDLWPGGSDLVFANEGNDTINVHGGHDTVFAGQGDDSAYIEGIDYAVYYLNEGSDTLNGDLSTGAMTVVGGNDSADGSDSIHTGSSDDLVYGNGGDDVINADSGDNTLVGGVGNDVMASLDGTDLIFGNEGDDTLASGDGQATTYGGQGNDQISSVIGSQLLIGGEGNDTLLGTTGRDTLSGGSGADVFSYRFDASEDGDNANGGGPVEVITDVDFDEDQFQVVEGIEFAANVGAVNAGNLEASGESALQAALALGGNAAFDVAAQFTFNGRTYLAINQDAANNLFGDTFDLLLDITGATGTIGANDFFV